VVKHNYKTMWCMESPHDTCTLLKLHISIHVYIPSSEMATSFLYTLKGYRSSVWILIEQSVRVSGIVYVFMGFVVHDWS